MPNQPDPNKVLVGMRTPRELVAVLTQEAQEQGLNLQGLIIRILQQYVGDPAKRLSRFELEDVEQEKCAARKSSGSRRCARGVGRAAGGRYEPGLVTGGMQSPVSDAVWRATMDNIVPGWRVVNEEDGFSLSSERVPGQVGVNWQEGEYMVHACYRGRGATSEFTKPLKWQYGGRRSGSSWRVPLAELGLELRPIREGELIAYMRSGKDDALHKLSDMMRRLIAALRAYHRRAYWCAAAAPQVQADGWYAYADRWRYLRCCKQLRDKQVGEAQLLVYEPIENESMRLELQLAPHSSGHLRTLLRAMGRRDLTGRVYNGRVTLEEADMPTTDTGEVDEERAAGRLMQRLSKWMQRINACLAEGLPLETFAALAVETANHDFASICELGVVIVRRGKITGRMRLPIQPEGNEYDEMFTQWHGITAADTADAPGFAEAWGQLAPALKGLPLVVHSGRTASRLLTAFQRAGLPEPEFALLQNLILARRAFPELPTHNLHDLAAHLGSPITSPGALPKAEACAGISLHLYARECGSDHTRA